MSSQDHAWELQMYSNRLDESISLGPGTLPNLTSSYKFYFNVRMAIFVRYYYGDICASLQVYPIEIKYLDFSCAGKGRDVNA